MTNQRMPDARKAELRALQGHPRSWLGEALDALEAAESARDAWAHQCNLASEAQAVLADVVGSVIVAGALAPGEQWRPSREHVACDAVQRLIQRAEDAERRADSDAHSINAIPRMIAVALGLPEVSTSAELCAALRSLVARAEAAEARAAKSDDLTKIR